MAQNSVNIPDGRETHVGIDKVNDIVKASTRKFQARFQIIQISFKASLA